jgi:hypothetical protein
VPHMQPRVCLRAARHACRPALQPAAPQGHVGSYGLGLAAAASGRLADAEASAAAAAAPNGHGGERGLLTGWRVCACAVTTMMRVIGDLRSCCGGASASLINALHVPCQARPQPRRTCRRADLRGRRRRRPRAAFWETSSRRTLSSPFAEGPKSSDSITGWRAELAVCRGCGCAGAEEGSERRLSRGQA